MSELKPCPFCGKEVELFPSHFEGQWCVHPPVIHCTACHQDYEGVGIAICDAMNDAKKEDFADNLLCNWWNRRPAEDALYSQMAELYCEMYAMRAALFEIANFGKGQPFKFRTKSEYIDNFRLIQKMAKDVLNKYAPDTGKMEG